MLRFTGERYLPSEAGEIRVEHYHRYSAILPLLKDKLVLDLASGEGYGAALMSSSAAGVLGVDINRETIRHAAATYCDISNLRFECGCATQTGAADCDFDIVISFETIEHLAEQAEMLGEIRRVLKPDGLLVISSPNRPIYSNSRKYCNEFHVKELDFAEFDALLGPHFGQIEYYGQRLAMGTVIQPLSENLDEYSAYSDDGIEVQQRTFSLRDPMYFLAVCGPAGQPLPKLNASIFLPDSLDLVNHYTGFARWAKQQDCELAIRDKNILHYQTEASNLEVEVETLRRSVAQGKSDLAMFENQRDQVRLEILRAQAQLDLLKSLYVDRGLGGI